MSKTEQKADKIIGILFFSALMGGFLYGISSLTEVDARKILQPEKHKTDSVQCVHCGWVFPIHEHVLPDSTRLKWKK